MGDSIKDYPKPFIRDVIDMMVISKKVDNEVIRELMIKHKMITKSTKTINAHLNVSNHRTDYQSLLVKNGRNHCLVYFSFKLNELDKITEYLREDN